MNIDFILNGEDVSTSAEPTKRLSDLLREQLGITSVMSDCMDGTCGKCVVWLDGKLVNSCLIPAFRVRGKEVVTFEGFRNTEGHATVAAAFDQTGTRLCGFCDAAVFMAAGSLLEGTTRPDDTTVVETMSSVYCRCTVPSQNLRAAHAAVDARYGGEYDRGR